MFLQVKDIKPIETDFCTDTLVMPKGWGMGKQGEPRWSRIVMWHIKLTGMVSKTECKWTFHPLVNRVILGWGQKVKSLNINYKINFKDFCTRRCVCSHKYVIKTIKRSFHLSPGSCPRDGAWRAGDKTNWAWGLAMAPNRLSVLVKLCI